MFTILIKCPVNDSIIVIVYSFFFALGNICNFNCMFMCVCVRLLILIYVTKPCIICFIVFFVSFTFTFFCLKMSIKNCEQHTKPADNIMSMQIYTWSKNFASFIHI